MAMADDLFTKELLHANDAVCLDGSPAALYHRPASKGGEHKFYVHLEGGGWCTDPESCALRAKTLLGSSLNYPDRMVPYQDRGYFNKSVAYFSTDPATNPQMFNWASVFLRYCDGQSFAGASKMLHGSSLLHFSGSGVLDAMIAQLIANHSLGNATDVVIGGASAGGLSVYLHADRWLHALPSSTRVTAMADSGFFLETDAVTGGSLPLNETLSTASMQPGSYATSMRNMVQMSNATSGLNKACVQAHTHTMNAHSQSESDAWRCIFAGEVSQYLSTPTFALQSRFDSWQLTNEMAPGESANITAVNGYGTRVLNAMKASLLADSKHGAFIDSCEHHCFKWGDINISGFVQAAAFAAWYNQNESAVSRRGVWDQGRPFPCTACCTDGF
jgi:hypothetical protein